VAKQFLTSVDCVAKLSQISKKSEFKIKSKNFSCTGGQKLLKISKITLEQRPCGLCSNFFFSDFEQVFAHCPVGKNLFKVREITLEQRPFGLCFSVILLTLGKFLPTGWEPNRQICFFWSKIVASEHSSVVVVSL